MPATNGPAVHSVLDGLDRKQKELLLAELVRDLYDESAWVESIIDANFDVVGYFMSLAARERYLAAALGYSSVDELPPEARGPYYSPGQILAHLESIAPSSDPEPPT